MEICRNYEKLFSQWTQRNGQSILAAVVLILLISIPMSCIWGIAYLVDHFSSWYILLFIPFFFLICCISAAVEAIFSPKNEK